MYTKSQDPKASNGVNIKYNSTNQAAIKSTYNPTFNQNNSFKPDSQHKKGRPGGGWDDDDNNNKSNQFNMSNTGTSTSTTYNPKSETKPFSFINSSKNDSTQQTNEYEIIEVDEIFLSKNEYEHKLINDSIQPGGARLKQSDQVLNDFCRAVENLNNAAIGSLIIYKLKSDMPWISKARALYNVEALVKKYPKYFEYFKKNDSVLKGLDFTYEGNYANQLKSITDLIINYLDDPQKGMNKAQPITQYQPQSDLIDLGSNKQPETKKLDAFKLFKKENSNANNLNNEATTPNNTKPNEIKPSISQGQTQLQTSQTQQLPINKPNAFGFINKSNSNPTSNSTNTQPLTTLNNTQPAQNPTNTKPNAFGFIKAKSQTLDSKPQQTNNSQQQQSQLQQQQPQQPQQTQQQQPSSQKPEETSLLNLNLSYPQEPRAGNILNLYGGMRSMGPGTGATGGFPHPGTNYPVDQSLLGLNFVSPIAYQHPSYAYGYPPQQQPGYPPLQQQHAGYPSTQHYQQQQQPGHYPGYPIGYQPNNPEMAKEMQNVANNTNKTSNAVGGMTEEQKKQELLLKQKKEEQDKYFDLLSFQEKEEKEKST